VTASTTHQPFESSTNSSFLFSSNMNRKSFGEDLVPVPVLVPTGIPSKWLCSGYSVVTQCISNRLAAVSRQSLSC